MDLMELVDPRHTALVTQECQNGVIGDAAVLRDLADEARRVAVPNIAKLVRAAHAADVPVVHCLAVRRADDRGSNSNARVFAATRKLGIRLEPGSREAELIPEIEARPEDLLLYRYHGVGPMGSTDLDPVLRNLGARTLVGVGVSGGLLPCPSALVVLLAAISLHRVAFGLLLIVAFSAGLALSITGVGLLAVLAKRAFSRLSFEGRLVALLPAVSALVILLVMAVSFFEFTWS